MTAKTAWVLTKKTVQEWQEDNALRLGASLSYYTVFSLAPLLIIVIGIAALVFGSDVARDRILEQLQTLLGQEGTGALRGILTEQKAEPSRGVFATILGFFTLLLGATGVVTELQNALNTVWDVPESKGGWKNLVRQRIISLAMILGIGFLLLVSLILSAGLTAFASGDSLIFEVFNFVLSLGVITVLFAAMFKFLPDTEVSWRDVWVGAFVTSALFTIGKTLTALYISKSAVASSFGAAGSLVIILVWVYYNSQILFLGAEFTQVYSRKYKPRQKELAPGEEIEKEQDLMEDEKQSPEVDRESPVYKVAFKAGYEEAKLRAEHKDLDSKLTKMKWVYRIVDFLGVRRSAKIGYKGYKVKKKIDALTGKDDKKKHAIHSETSQQQPEQQSKPD